MNVFVNGNLKASRKFDSLPKQNYGDIYVNNNRGFSGYLSNITYYAKYITYSDLNYLLRMGPSPAPCIDADETPPYIASNWYETNVE